MLVLWIILGVLAFAVIATLIISYVCYRIAFFVDRKKDPSPDAICIPEGEIYEVYRDKMVNWILEARAMKREKFYITSFDGLKLCGTYYEYEPGAPIELMFHGYRGHAERDLSGGVQRCFRLKRSALIVDQRCSNESQGHVITFGVNEHKDCLAWVDFMVKHFGEDVKIILTGISMGASTVLMAAGNPLPKNVIGVLADCGFTSAKEIIQKVIKQMGLPPKLAYPFVKLGAKIYGGFDLEETSAIECVKKSTVPIFFLHGESDDFVPCDMSCKNYEACASKKHLFTVPGAGHGLGYLVDTEGYINNINEFFAGI